MILSSRIKHGNGNTSHLELPSHLLSNQHVGFFAAMGIRYQLEKTSLAGLKGKWSGFQAFCK